MGNRLREWRGKRNKEGRRVLWSVWKWVWKLWKADDLSSLTSMQTEEKTDEGEGEKPLPSMRYRPTVHGFYCQSVALPNSELNTWCHSNDPSAVKKSSFKILIEFSLFWFLQEIFHRPPVLSSATLWELLIVLLMGQWHIGVYKSYTGYLWYHH